MEGFAVLWLLFNTTVGQCILAILIVYVLICLLEWWTIPVVIAIIACWYLQERWANKKRKKREKEERLQELRREYLREDTNTGKQKKLLTKKEVAAEVAKLKEKRPDAIIREIVDCRITRAYWLMIGKGRQRRETLDCKMFTIKFAMTEDRCGMKMIVTNTSDGVIKIDWQSLKINNRAAYIDGILGSKYKGEGSLAPKEVVTKLLQARKEHYGDNFLVMFNLNEIDKKELRYDVSLDVIDENDERKSFLFDVYTRLQIIS